MLIRDGVVTEGTKTNFFGVVNGSLRTHPCDSHILPGITRSVLRDLARDLDIELDETPIKASEIPKLSELFLTGTTTDVMPVVKLDDKPVGKGKAGRAHAQVAARAGRESCIGRRLAIHDFRATRAIPARITSN